MKKLLLNSTLIMLTFIACVVIIGAGCEGEQGPAGPAGEQGVDGMAGEQGVDGMAGVDATACAVCHDDTELIVAKKTQWEQSGHGTGTAYGRGTSASCAPCHSSEGFSMKLAGMEATGVPDPTPPGCRACHNIHTDFAETDWSLATTASVELTGIMYSGATIDIGKGNLCANCHQTRERTYDLELGGADVEISSSHWGPHHGTQANYLTGNGGYEVVGSVAYANSPHGSMVTDTCVTCHLVDDNHTFEPDIDACTTCHADLSSFDLNDVQTEVSALLDELKELLLADGLLAGEDDEVHPVSGVTTSADKAGSLLNYLGLVDDGSHGVHNAKYIKALLQNSIEALE